MFSKINLENLVFLCSIMYDHENNDPASNGEACQSDPPVCNSAGPAKPAAQRKSDAVMLNCPYCRKEFDRETTKSMPFCSSRCKQIDLGLWLNEVHGMPYEIDPGVE